VVAGKRVEVAHFWQDHCLSIRVFRSRKSLPVIGWIQSGTTRIRIRETEVVPEVPLSLNPSGWLPFVAVLASFVATLAYDRPGTGHDVFEAAASLDARFDLARFHVERPTPPRVIRGDSRGCSKGADSSVKGAERSTWMSTMMAGPPIVEWVEP
jgi:hypothetical protein